MFQSAVAHYRFNKLLCSHNIIASYCYMIMHQRAQRKKLTLYRFFLGTDLSKQLLLSWLPSFLNFLSKNLLEKQLDFKQLPTDSSGQYKVDVNFLLAKTRVLKEELDVTLVTHCTSNHLHYLLELTEHWKGPISLGV